MVIRCPNPDCRQELELPDGTRVRRARCSSCGKVLDVQTAITSERRPAPPPATPPVPQTTPAEARELAFGREQETRSSRPAPTPSWTPPTAPITGPAPAPGGAVPPPQPTPIPLPGGMSPGARSLLIALGVFAVVVVLTVAGAVAYLLVRDPEQVRKAQSQLDAKLYDEAVQTLIPFVQAHPENHKAAYLLALANLDTYAAAQAESRPAYSMAAAQYNRLREVRKYATSAFAGNARWSRKARRSFADAADLVPLHAGDALRRLLAIARLRQELGLADPKKLAAELVAKAGQHPETKARGLQHEQFLLRVVEWDPSLAKQVAGLALPPPGATTHELSRALSCLQRAATKNAALAQAMAPMLIVRADECIKAGGCDQAETLLATIERVAPDRADTDVVPRRLKCLEARLATGDPLPALYILDRTIARSPAAKSQAAATLVPIMLRRADHFGAAGDQRRANALLAAVERLDPKRGSQEVADRRLDHIEQALSTGDPNAGLAMLQSTLRQSPDMRQKAATRCCPILLKRAERCAAAGEHDTAERLLSAVEQMEPQRSGELAQLRLKYLRMRLAGGDAGGTVQALDRLVRRAPAVKTKAARLYLDAATVLMKSDPRAAQGALRRALDLDPRVVDDEQTALRCIQLMPKPDQAKLALCTDFLRKFPDSKHRPRVLLTMVHDAVAAFDGTSRWQRDRARPTLEAAFAAAKELTEKHPAAPGLDGAVFNLAQRLGSVNKAAEALTLAVGVLKAVPDTPLKLQIEQARATWRRQTGRGTLSPELDELADRVGRELKKIVLTTPGAVRSLAESPRAVHVVEIARDCTANKFSSEGAALLRNWVGGGGVLWVNNDVAHLFGIGYKSSWSGSTCVCQPGVTAEMCPILQGCKTVQIRWRGGVYNLSAKQRIIPLLTATEYGNRRWCPWSLIRYGKGLISNVQDVDVNTYDGGRFWLNFRLYCLGWDIPGSGQARRPTPPPSEAASKPATPQRESSTPEEPVAKPESRIRDITSVAQLEDALADKTPGRVLYVQLKRKALRSDQHGWLKDWVRRGGVLWVDTDLVRSFGFPNLRQAKGGYDRGEATVLTKYKHPILEGLEGTTLNYEFSAEPLVPLDLGMAGSTTKPLLGRSARLGATAILCAVREYGKGTVVYRPTVISTDTETGRRFLANLQKFSLEAAQKGTATNK